MFPKSIRWRLQLWIAFLLVCILSGFGVTAYQLHRTNWLSRVDEELDRRVALLGNDIQARFRFGQPPGRRGFGPESENETGGPPPHRRLPFDPGLDSGPGRSGPEPFPTRGWPGPRPEFREIQLSLATQRLFDETETNGYYYAVWSREGSLLKRSTNAPADLQAPGRLAADPRMAKRMRGDFREALQRSNFGEAVLVGRSLTADLRAFRGFTGWLVAAGGTILALGLWGGWLLATGAIRPVEEISAAASRISAGHLSERISVADTDSELGRLADVLNSTFARLEAAFAQQKQFTADASHELRTPIAVIISDAQATLARPRTAEEYRETVETCLEAAQQMRRLTQSLLELARFDAGQVQIERESFDLAERVRGCVHLLQPLAEERKVRCELDLIPLEICADADRVTQVLTNLLSNAVHYNQEGGSVRVTLREDAAAAILSVKDTGAGIAAADLPHLFKRFHRADPSRARGGERFGLGLAICKAIVDLHGGSIEVASEPGVGSVFTVRLPTKGASPNPPA
jgi:heavy metal sensor kinase